MKNIEPRLKRAEDTLHTKEEPKTINIVHFGEGKLPLDRQDENILVHYVRYQEGAVK